MPSVPLKGFSHVFKTFYTVVICRDGLDTCLQTGKRHLMQT
jgi:hypothetical protein